LICFIEIHVQLIAMRHLLIDSKESLLLFVELVIDTREKLVSSANSFTCSSDQIQFLQYHYIT